MEKGFEYYSDYASMHFAKMRWFGVKRYFKMVLGFKPLNLLIVFISRLILPSKILIRVPINKKEVSVFVAGQSFIMLNPMRCSIAKEIYWCKGSRAKAHDQFALTFFSSLASKADYVLDIGANTGIFSLASAKASDICKVHSFEIVPDVYRILFENICRNNLLSRITPHCCGIGRNNQIVTMPLYSKDSDLPSSLSTASNIKKGIEIPIISLDAFLPQINPDSRVLIKIDVEGTEADIFEQATAFLKSFSPDILCEILPWALHCDQLGKILHDNGYHLHKVTSDSLQSAHKLAPDPYIHDWFFTKDNNLEI